jgi:hypothetical protein
MKSMMMKEKKKVQMTVFRDFKNQFGFIK